MFPTGAFTPAVSMLDHVTILLAEDDKNDAFLMRRGLQQAGVPNPLIVLEDGREVINYLGGNGEYAARDKFPLPGLILLDLKMPWIDGFDILAWLRSRKQFDLLPVVILTSSKLQSDVDRSRQLGVFDYRVKPQGLEDLVRLLDDVRKCWLDERFNRFCWLSGTNSGTTAGDSPSPR
jgi:CheY-like chemotaxis protein